MSVRGTTISCPYLVQSVTTLLLWCVLSAHPLSNSEDFPDSLFPLQQNWSVSLEHLPTAAPAFDEEYAYVPLGNDTVVAISLIDGTLRWSVTAATNFSPAIGNGIIVVAHETHLQGLNPIDASHLWTREMNSRISGPLLLTGGWLIVSLENGKVVTFRASDGVQLWQQELGGKLIVRPSIGGDELYIPVEDGRIVSLELASGRILWERRLSGRPAVSYTHLTLPTNREV